MPRMLGYTVEEFTGLTFADVLHPDFLELWSERYERRIGAGAEPQRRYEVQLLNRDGDRPLWIELIASRFTYRDEPAVLGIVRDI
ncbi:PAS domain S-box protein, partial [Acinetobacter baumannii]